MKSRTLPLSVFLNIRTLGFVGSALSTAYVPAGRIPLGTEKSKGIPITNRLLLCAFAVAEANSVSHTKSMSTTTHCFSIFTSPIVVRKRLKWVAHSSYTDNTLKTGERLQMTYSDKAARKRSNRIVTQKCVDFSREEE